MATVIVRGAGSGFEQEVVVDRHHLKADEPTAAGGTDIGPSPYDYLLVALGT
jgi:putative redox protein